MLASRVHLDSKSIQNSLIKKNSTNCEKKAIVYWEEMEFFSILIMVVVTWLYLLQPIVFGAGKVGLEDKTLVRLVSPQNTWG